MKSLHSFIIAAMATVMAACSSSQSEKSLGDGWTINGTIAQAADTTLYIEGSKLNNWYVIDSLKLDSDGSFSFQAAEPDTIGSIYRVRLGDRYVYFPASGTETVTLTASANDISRGFTLKGSPTAMMFATVDSLINTTVDRLGVNGALADSALKVTLNKIVNRDTTCLVSYYVVGKFIGGKPYYDLTNSRDIAVVGNAANNWTRHRPDDARTADLTQRFITAKNEIRRANPNRPAREITITDDHILGRPNVDMKMYDRTGKMHDFNQLATNGKVTVINFTRYDGPASPANTVALNTVYRDMASRGLQIYQVSFDPDELNFKQSAASMPWTAVWATPAMRPDIMMGYNVNPIENAPTSFVLNRRGEIVARVSNPNDLAKTIAPLL